VDAFSVIASGDKTDPSKKNLRRVGGIPDKHTANNINKYKIQPWLNK